MWQPSNLTSRAETQALLLTASGSLGVKGSWSDIGSPTSFAYEMLTIMLCYAGTASPASYSVDLGISDGTNRFIIAEHLTLTAVKFTRSSQVQICIPIHVPAGAQLSARSAGSNDCYVVVTGHSAGVGGAPGFSRCIPLFTPTNDRGTAIDPGGSANTKGSWIELTSSCPNDIAAMFGITGFAGDTARAAAGRCLYDIGVGAAAAEQVVSPNNALYWGASVDGPMNTRLPLFACNVPLGTRIAARSQASITPAGDRTFDLSLYGLVI